MRVSWVFQIAFIGLASAKSFWKLDSSCKKDGLEDLVVEAVNSAFSMAEKLRTPIQDAIDKKQIKDIHGQVIQWMFMPDGHSYKTPFQVQIAAGILNENLKNLVSTKNRNDEASLDEVNNIVFYCDLSRFEETSNKKSYYDKDVDKDLRKSSSIEACKGITPPTLAYTMIWMDDDKASQIQLCPWMLDWAKKIKGLIDAKDLNKKARFVEYLANKAVAQDIVLSPIDLESILDKVILHEMTHTVVGGASRDIDEGNLLKVRYGWKRCRALAKEGDTSKTRMGQENADSIALAAFAIKLSEEGIQVREDGTLTKTS